MPSNLSCLSQTTGRSLWLEGPDDQEQLIAFGTLVASPHDVPEPAILALMAVTLGGTLGRVRRRSFTKTGEVRRTIRRPAMPIRAMPRSVNQIINRSRAAPGSPYG